MSSDDDKPGFDNRSNPPLVLSDNQREYIENSGEGGDESKIVEKANSFPNLVTYAVEDLFLYKNGEYVQHLDAFEGPYSPRQTVSFTDKIRDILRKYESYHGSPWGAIGRSLGILGRALLESKHRQGYENELPEILLEFLLGFCNDCAVDDEKIGETIRELSKLHNKRKLRQEQDRIRKNSYIENMTAKVERELQVLENIISERFAGVNKYVLWAVYIGLFDPDLKHPIAGTKFIRVPEIEELDRLQKKTEGLLINPAFYNGLTIFDSIITEEQNITGEGDGGIKIKEILNFLFRHEFEVSTQHVNGERKIVSAYPTSPPAVKPKRIQSELGGSCSHIKGMLQRTTFENNKETHTNNSVVESTTNDAFRLTEYGKYFSKYLFVWPHSKPRPRFTSGVDESIIPNGKAERRLAHELFNPICKESKNVSHDTIRPPEDLLISEDA